MCLSQSFCVGSVSWFGSVGRAGRLRATSNNEVLSEEPMMRGDRNRHTAMSGCEGERRGPKGEGKCGESADGVGQGGSGWVCWTNGCRDGKGYDVKRAMAHSTDSTLQILTLEERRRKSNMCFFRTGPTTGTGEQNVLTCHMDLSQEGHGCRVA